MIKLTVTKEHVEEADKRRCKFGFYSICEDCPTAIAAKEQLLPLHTGAKNITVSYVNIHILGNNRDKIVASYTMSASLATQVDGWTTYKKFEPGEYELEDNKNV